MFTAKLILGSISLYAFYMYLHLASGVVLCKLCKLCTKKTLFFLQLNVEQTGGKRGIDLNVVPAWKEGFNGEGVVVTTLDDGIYHEHPDLRNNYVRGSPVFTSIVMPKSRVTWSNLLQICS